MLLLLLLLLFLMLTLTVIDVWYQAYKGEVGVTYASEVGVDVGQCIPVTRVSMTSTRATSLVVGGCDKLPKSKFQILTSATVLYGQK